MNDIEKAIEVLKMENELMQFDPMTGEIEPIELQNQDNQDLYNANLIAISVLEKQTPKEIIYDYGLNETRCPRCNTIFGYAYEEDETEDMYYAPYCYECGQCLDWEVENE
jgi:hypothetical protein